MKRTLKATILTVIAVAGMTSAPALARDQMHIVSTPADFPYTAMVGEQFARSYRLPGPLIERRNAHSAVSYFCAGVGWEHPDVVGLGRPLRAYELARCRENGVGRITEIKVGYDGVVVASDAGAGAFALTRRQLFQAMAAEVPAGGRLVPNPYRSWRSIDARLPDRPIRIVGPLLHSEMGQAVVELVMEPGCRSFPEIQALDPERAAQVCGSFRNDHVFQQISRRYEDALRRVAADRDTIALLPYSLFEENRGRLAAHPIEGVVPDEVSLAMDRYPVACPFYLYVKLAHYEYVPGILEFVAEYTSDRAWGPDGYLAETGLVPLSHRGRIDQRANAIGLNPMKGLTR